MLESMGVQLLPGGSGNERVNREALEREMKMPNVTFTGARRTDFAAERPRNWGGCPRRLKSKSTQNFW